MIEMIRVCIDPDRNKENNPLEKYICMFLLQKKKADDSLLFFTRLCELNKYVTLFKYNESSRIYIPE